MKKAIIFILVVALLVLGYFTFVKPVTIEGTYKIGKNGYDVVKEMTLDETNNSFLAYLTYSITSPLINDSIKLEATLTKDGNLTLVNGTRYLDNNTETKHYKYYIDRDNRVCIYDGKITNVVNYIGTLSEDRNTFYMLFEGGYKVPLDRI